MNCEIWKGLTPCMCDILPPDTARPVSLCVCVCVCVCVVRETRLQKYWKQCLHDCYSAIRGFVLSTKRYESDSTEVSSCG
jgi:hypothetical protein